MSQIEMLDMLDYELVSLDGNKSAFIQVEANLRVIQLAQRIAKEQGVPNYTRKVYVIADAYTGLPFVEDQHLPITRIPEFSSIRLVPTGAAKGNYYRLKNFSIVYLLWSTLQAVLLASALIQWPGFLYRDMPQSTWIAILIMLSILLVTAFIGLLKNDSTYVVDSTTDDTKRFEFVLKQQRTLILLGLFIASFVCVASFQLGLGNWISVIRGTVIGFVVTVIVAVASAFANRD